MSISCKQTVHTFFRRSGAFTMSYGMKHLWISLNKYETLTDNLNEMKKKKKNTHIKKCHAIFPPYLYINLNEHVFITHSFSCTHIYKIKIRYKKII